MLRTLANAWKIADLRKKILFTAIIVLIFRIGAAIPVPFVAAGANGIFSDSQMSGTFMEYLNMMTGNAFNYGTIFAMSITPYINSSIIVQLLTVAIPALERLAKDGEEGRKKIATITRYVTVGLALLQSTAYYFYLRGNNYLLMKDVGVFADIFQALVIILCFSAGCALIMWLGEQINDKGIGNGISIILFAGIVGSAPSSRWNTGASMWCSGRTPGISPPISLVRRQVSWSCPTSRAFRRCFPPSKASLIK